MQSRYFSYLSLGEDEIRLLVIEPASVCRSSVLECRIKHILLAQEPRSQYDTISYCWGNSKDRTYIKIKEQFLAVPTSAERALRKMRDPIKERTVWIDAICIDQKDKLERGMQVNMMDRIYGSTQRNLIFLGENHGSNFETALENMQIVHGSMRDEVGQDFTHLGQYLRDANGQFRFSESALPTCDHTALLWLYSRPWFGRLWVLQEAALAPENVCFCGDLTVDLIDVLRVAAWLHYKFFFLQRELSISHGLASAVGMFDFVDKNHGTMRVKETSRIRLYEMFNLTNQFETSLPHDQVYGLVGLLASDQRFNFSKNSIPKPDYSKPCSTVFVPLTRLMLEDDKTLDFLDHVRHTSCADITSNGPSWAPRWDRKRDQNKHGLALGHFFNASDSILEQKIHAQGPSFMLRLAGFPLGTVRRTSSSFSNNDFLVPKRIFQMIQGVEQVLREGDGSQKFEDSANPLGWILIAGKNSGNQPARNSDIAVWDLISYILATGELPPSILESFQDTSGRARNITRYFSAMRNACVNRRAFVTSAGFVGIGDQLLRHNDIVCIVFGSRWPVILRPQGGNRFSFVGLCFIYGVMYGDLVNKYSKERRPCHTFSVV